MFRRLRQVAAVAALLSLATAIPGLPSAAAASSCSGWTSQDAPPPTIRVFRHLSGAVETVDFSTYAKNVLSREWIESWTTESLRSGALAVKHYAWYQVLHWRGGANANGDCFDVRDDTADQVYDPSQPTYATAAAAVDDTWGTRVLRDGAIFPTYYNAGAFDEECGAGANGWVMYQWGTQACGLAGKTAAQIIVTYYYPGVTVISAPAPLPMPAPPSTTSRTPLPPPAPAPPPQQATPPPPQAQPGGGQAGVVEELEPPTPPPPSSEPVVRAPAERLDRTVVREADASALWRAGLAMQIQAPDTSSRLRLAPFSVLWLAAIDELERSLAAQFAARETLP